VLAEFTGICTSPISGDTRFTGDREGHIQYSTNSGEKQSQLLQSTPETKIKFDKKNDGEEDDAIIFFPEAEFLDKIQTKVKSVFLLLIHSHLSSFALTFFFLQTHATSSS
jgi:hypothetical protein